MKSALSFVLPLVLSAPCVAQTTYGLGCGVTTPNFIYELDASTGAATVLWGEDLDFCDAAGGGVGTTFYAIDCDAQLILIDVEAQSATPLGYLPAALNGLAYDSATGVLYATNYIDLYTVDPATATATYVGSHNVAALWALAYDPFRDRLIGYDEATVALHVIDAQTGAATQIGPTGQTRVTDLWVDPLTGRTFGARNFPDRFFEFDPIAGGATYIADLPDSLCGLGAFGGDGAGSSYCSPAVPNSTGLPGRAVAGGSTIAADNAFFLSAYDLPPAQFGYFIVAASQGFVPNPAGSQGNLCLATPIGRYASLVQAAGALGVLSIQPDLTALPLTPAVAVVAGESWNFQCWYRDVNPGPTSNFTDATSVLFL